MSSRWQRVSAAILAALTLAACGTSVRTTSEGGALDSSGQLAAPPQGGAVDGSGGSTVAPGSSGPGAAQGLSGGSSSARGPLSASSAPTSVSESPGGSVPSVGTSGPGVTAQRIYIGVDYATEADYFNQAAGVTNAAVGDERAYGRAVIDDINKHGGIAGRSLVPVWHAYDGTSTQTADVQEEAACADWTQDHHVFGVTGLGGDAYNSCVTRAGAVIVDDNLPELDAAQFARYPNLVELCCPSLDRLAAEQATALLAQRYFTPWDTTNGKPGVAKAKVGILTYDDPNFTGPVDNILAPAIRRAGYPVEVAHALKPGSNSDLGAMSASIQSAELKFHTDGVTHVIIFEAKGELSLFFLKDAQSQHYYPRYGVNSGNASQLLIDGGEADPAQFNGALGFSFTPFSDIPEDKNPDNGRYSNNTRRHCVAVMKAHGITFPSANGESVALLYCDELYFMKYAVERAGPVINASTFLNAVNHIGDGFQDAVNFRSFLGPGRHDAAAAVYYYGYVPSCTCMAYHGPLQNIG